ncbi:hypothetical protein KVV02_002160 [Mortierella alpina]|uniref:Uncharacterized protein n=2 Tax=Mortierella alpina TaxID=64518 RepID=A0A9P7ZZQ5_MORAP|nr:hypothetical protein KVV02_002160 [Mortierella alpina]
MPTGASNSTPPLNTSAPKRNNPPTLPPARAHGIHARSLARPPSTLLSASPASPGMASPSTPDSARSTHSTPTSAKASVVAPLPPGSRESTFPAPILQAPQQSHQPRQRPVPSARSPVESSFQPRPAPPPVRQSSGLSGSVAVQQPVPIASDQTPSATVVGSKKDTALDSNSKEQKGSDSNPPDPEPNDDDCDEDDAIKFPEEATKRTTTRQRKVRKSLEKLTRSSLEKRRRSRQMKALTSIPPSTSSTMTPLKANTLTEAPKRLSLWASLFGNGMSSSGNKTEARPAVSDSLDKSDKPLDSVAGSRANAGSSAQQASSSPATDSSSRSEKTLSDASSHSSRSSESLEQDDDQPQFSRGESIAESSSTNSAPSLSDVSVARHERTRTLPGMLPQWDGSILWSLTKALGAKKTEAPPLDSDSSDSDSSEETPAVEDGDEHAGESEDAASTKSFSSLGEHSAAEAGTEEAEKRQSSPVVPAREALSIRTHIPEQRVIVAEAQVQIGDESGDEEEDEDPFTDSHALPVSVSPSVISSTPTKGQLSAVSASPVSSTSPSLSPLSYLTGSSASGSTWSLQGSRQSLMKMIFKSKNEQASSAAAETGSQADFVDQLQYKAESPLGSASPSTPSQAPHMDLFADFESTASLPTSLDIQTKDTKRRSFLTPGAFPGQGEAIRDEVQESDLGYEQAHVPMYAASEGDSLAFAQDDTRQCEQEGSDEMDDGDQDDTNSDSSDYEEDVISTLPFKNSYERSSFLQEPPLPRFNPNPARSSPGHQQRAFPKRLTNPVSVQAPSHDVPAEQEPLQIAVHSVIPQPPTKPTPQTTLKDKLDTSKPLLRGKLSPPMTSSHRQDSTKASRLLTDDKSLVSSLTPPSMAAGGSSSRSNKQPAETFKTHVVNRTETKAPNLDNDIDYCRYKEEVTEPNAPRRASTLGQGGRPRDDDTTATSSEETESSEQTGGDSPLVVEVISSGLRSAGPDNSAAPLSAFGSGARRGSAPNAHHVPVHAPQLHQPQGKMNNPPPLPPPRNSRRPRSKTLSRYGSKDNIRLSLEQLSRPSFTGHAVSDMKAVSHRYESPTKEHIMEEMGSEQARAFSEEDFVYCQNDKIREVIRTNSLMSQGNEVSHNQQGYGQPYGKGNNAFDEYSSSTSDYQQPPTTKPQQAAQQPAQAPVVHANDALLVATLRDQIASLSSERDQFYQETLILRQKHEMLTSLVSNMGVAVESIQQQQLLQQHQQQQQQQQQHQQQQHHHQQQQYHAQHALESGIMGSLSSMSLPVMAGSDSLLNNYQPQHGQSEYVVPDHQQPQHVPRRHHEDQAAQYIDQVGQGEDSSVHAPYGFATHSQQNVCADLYPIQPQQEEPQLQPRRNHFHEADLQRSERVRQLSDEYSIQMPRNSEESLRGFHQQSQPDLIQEVPQGHGLGFQAHAIAQDPSQTIPASQGPYDAETFQDAYDGQHLHDSFVQQQQQHQHPQKPASFGEGYDLIPSGEIVGNDTAMMNEGARASEYFQQQQQHQQSLDEIHQQGGLTLQQLKHQHQQSRSEGHQYRRSTDTRHSSQTSQDGYQLMDVITTRPMSGGMASTGLSHGPMEFGYGGGHQPQRQDLDFGPTNPFSSNYNPALQALPTRDQAQHMGHLRLQQEPSDAPGSHLRRHHSMQYPQSSSRQFSAPEMVHSAHQQSSQYQQQQQQPSSQYPSQASEPRAGHGRPPVWEPSHHHQSRSSSSSRIDHRRQRSNPQQDAPFPSQPDKGMLLLSSSTSFMNAHEYRGESPCLGSAGLHGAASSSTAPLSMFSNVVQQEKVRIEERTSTLNGAAGWSERPFSPVMASASEALVGEDAAGSSSRHMASFAEIMASTGSLSTSLTGAAKTRVLTKDTTDKIRQQFDSYLADPKRRSRHLDSEREAGERDQREEQRMRHDLETETLADATSDSGSESDDEREEGEGEEDEERSRQMGSHLLGRSKTLASTGISTRMNRVSGQDHLEQQQQQRPNHGTGGGGGGGVSVQQQHKGLQSAKETLVRHHSSSGSLRSVARHSEQSRIVNKDTTADVAVTHGPLVLLGGQGSSSSSGSDVHAGVPSQGLPQQPQKAQQQQQQAHPHLSRQNIPVPPATLPRPAVAYKVPVDSPRLPSFPPAASSSSKTVIDEEGGDWGLQAQPRRYNSVKLGMTGVTGATRRAIGRPVEKGHGLELGPEDCV